VTGARLRRPLAHWIWVRRYCVAPTEGNTCHSFNTSTMRPSPGHRHARGGAWPRRRARPARLRPGRRARGSQMARRSFRRGDATPYAPPHVPSNVPLTRARSVACPLTGRTLTLAW